MKIFKKLFSMLLALALIVGAVNLNAPVSASAADTGVADISQEFRELTADEIVKEMGAGWNLGNTMDGHTGFTPGETIWQSTITTKALIEAVHDHGFNTVRIPITWGTMIDDENNYHIDDSWISRVQDIVDYCIAYDMYVIINVHHDGAEQSGWLRIAAEDTAPVFEKYEAVWKQIAEYFKHYDEHLIFESMNEVTGPSSSADGIKKDMQVIMELNQVFVDTVRATGSNNARRWLSVPGRYTNIDNTTNPSYGFALPKDTAENRLFVSVHDYDYTFGLVETMGATGYSSENAANLAKRIKKLYDSFTSAGVPVILGEYGAVNKNNDLERIYYCETMTSLCQKYGVVACYWDNGEYDLTKDPADFCFTLIDRKTGNAVYPEIISAIMRGTYNPSNAENAEAIEKGTTVTPFSSIETSFSEISMEQGEDFAFTVETSPADSNDVVLYKSSDYNVVSVSNGKLHAVGIGSAQVTAYSQSGSASTTINVTVYPASDAPETTRMALSETSLLLPLGSAAALTTNIQTEGDIPVHISYRSSDDSVATVSKLGKVVATGLGSAYIIATAADGYTKFIPVTVISAGTTGELSLAINVYYNDSETSYFSNEVGEVITVTDNGQYTLTFDCNEHLSAAAAKAGVNALKNLTAVYIKDFAVTDNKAVTSPLESCDIMFDSVLVNDVPMTITQTEPKTAIKSSGILDTNDPLNSWDGSQVEEVTVTNHVLNITNVENPTKITVTFTLSNLVFKAEETESGTKASGMKAAETVKMDSEPESLSVIVTPPDSDTKVCFISSDSSVVYVNPEASAVDPETGLVSADLTYIGNGDTVIKVYSDDGFSVNYSLRVSSVADRTLTPDITEAAPEDEAVQPEEPGTEEPDAEVTPEITESASPEVTPETTPAVTPAESENDSDGPSTKTILSYILGILVIILLGVFAALITQTIINKRKK